MRASRPAALLLSALLTGVSGRAAGPPILTVEGRSSQTPWAASLGRFVAVAWGASVDGKADVYVALSQDEGRTFGRPVRVNDIEGEARLGGELPPRVALVSRAGGGAPEIVVVFGSKGTGTAIKVSRSLDGGRTFAPGRALQAPGAAGDRGWHAMALDAAGAAHVMWLDHRGLAARKTQGHDHHEAAAIDGVAMAQLSGLYYAREGPDTTSGERELLKGVCYCCKVAMAAGPRGEIYAAWRHVYAGNIRDIAFMASRDGGRSFDPQGRVSQDDWHLAGCPDDGPAMVVDAEGTVHVVWPTVMGGETPEGALFYASSRDGRTFSPRVRIPTLGSPKPMHPQVVADGAGRLTVAWDEVLDGVRQAAMRTLTFDEAGQPRFGATTLLGARGTPSSYPVLVPTPRGTLAVYVDGEPGASVIRAGGS
ncbi:MAG: hypothetical protein AB7H81_04495 [Vicinamibacterales bacterium]